mgnify:CR=1 FL=1
MHQQISKKILTYFFLFTIFGTLNNKNLNEFEFLKIDRIDISGIDIENKLNLIKELDFFKFQNIFFLDKTRIQKIISSNPFVEKFSILKKYPSELKIEIHKTKFLAYVKKKDGLFFLGSNQKLIMANSEIENVPYIFGNFDIKEFFILKNLIDDSKFEYQEIKNLFFFPSRRWDIEMHSGVIIRLPNSKLKESLELSFKIISDENLENIKMIDLRQNSQMIINE